MRRTVEVRIEGDPETNRDSGKLFVVTEMPAVMGEKWASRLLVLLAQSGADLPEGWDKEDTSGGMADVASLLKIGAPFLGVLQDPSLEDWWTCVKYQHRPNQPPQTIQLGERCQIEEISTVQRLRMEVLKLHTGFFSTARPLTSASTSPAPTPTGSSATRISRPPSAR